MNLNKIAWASSRHFVLLSLFGMLLYAALVPISVIISFWCCSSPEGVGILLFMSIVMVIFSVMFGYMFYLVFIKTGYKYLWYELKSLEDECNIAKERETKNNE